MFGLSKPNEALFDINIDISIDISVVDINLDTDAQSHLHRTPESILNSAGALEKKKLYKKTVEDKRGTFTPF